MRVRLLGFWIWCLSGTNFPSIAGEISPQLRGELHTYMTYNPCHRMGLNRNAEDCSQSVGKFKQIPENDRGPCKTIHRYECHSKFFEFDNCRVWVTGPGIPHKTRKTLNWCVTKALRKDTPSKKSSLKFWKKFNLRKKSKHG
nr:PREDICTED: uncharacterized protein LOC109036072 isoform X1 [Bemisia tabaci]